MRALDAFFALRPMVLVPAWSFFLLGHAAAAPGSPAPLLAAGLFTLAMIGVHLVNQVADRDTDRINDKGFFLQHGVFRVRDYVIAAVLCIAMSLVTGVVARTTPWLLGASIGIGLAYSLRPVRLAARPGLDLLANGLGYGALAPLLGAGGADLSRPFLVATMLAVGAVFVHTTLLDLDGDERTGKRTTGVVLGPAMARVLAGLLGVGSVAAAFSTPFWFVRLPALATGALAVAAWVAPRRITSRSVCVAATALFAVAAGWTWPPFLVGLIVLALASRLYYARRFGIRYPAL